MFSWQHFVWLGICALLIGFYHWLFDRKLKLPLQKFLLVASIILFILIVATTFGNLDFLPYAENSEKAGYYAPYLDPKYFPLHMCSVQFILFFIASRVKEETRRKFMIYCYPTCAFGAMMALLMPDIFSNVDKAQAFIHPLYYFFFLIHSFLLYSGFKIGFSKEVNLHFKDFIRASIIITLVGILAIYVNSAFTVVNRSDDGLPSSIVSNSNLFFIFDIPIKSIKITEKWQWIVYFFILFIAIWVVCAIYYLPFYFIDKKKKSASLLNEENTFDISQENQQEDNN